jgi:hypothetical protein
VDGIDALGADPHDLRERLLDQGFRVPIRLFVVVKQPDLLG